MFVLNWKTLVRFARLGGVSCGNVIYLLISRKAFKPSSGLTVKDIVTDLGISERAVRLALDFLLEHEIITRHGVRAAKWYIKGISTFEQTVFLKGYEKVARDRFDKDNH